MPELQDGKKFFYRDRSVADNAAECAEGDFLVKGNGDWKALGIARVAKADMAFPSGVR